MKYDVVQNEHFPKFLEEVNKRLEDGWVLQGGINVCRIPQRGIGILRQ